jgi:hypothetical protein
VYIFGLLICCELKFLLQCRNDFAIDPILLIAMQMLFARHLLLDLDEPFTKLVLNEVVSIFSKITIKVESIGEHQLSHCI